MFTAKGGNSYVFLIDNKEGSEALPCILSPCFHQIIVTMVHFFKYLIVRAIKYKAYTWTKAQEYNFRLFLTELSPTEHYQGLGFNCDCHIYTYPISPFILEWHYALALSILLSVQSVQNLLPALLRTKPCLLKRVDVFNNFSRTILLSQLV